MKNILKNIFYHTRKQTLDYLLKILKYLYV